MKKSQTMNIQHRVTGEVFFVTDTVVDWIDVFTRPVYKHIILESLAYCQQQKGLIIYARVLMSNHLHAIVGSNGQEGVSDIWRDFKKYTSKKIIEAIKTEISENRSEWMLNRFEYAAKNDKKIKNYRFWQEGNNASRRIANAVGRNDLTLAYANRLTNEHFGSFPTLGIIN